MRGIDLEKHKVVDVWERMNFLDNEAFRISASLNKRSKLLDIANEMEQRLRINEINSDENSVVGVDTTLFSLRAQTQMARSGEKLMNDLIIFLTICPNGLDLFEIEILLKRFPSQLDKGERDTKIRLYLSLFREAACKEEGTAETVDSLIIDTTADG